MAEAGQTKTGKNQSEIAERRRRALELRRAGVGYTEIARQIGVNNPGTAYKIVQKALKLTYQEPADDVRKLELERLDRLMLAYWSPAIGTPARKDDKGKAIDAIPPDPLACDRVMKIMQQRAALLGLKITEVAVTVNSASGSLDPEISRRVLDAASDGEGIGS